MQNMYIRLEKHEVSYMSYDRLKLDYCSSYEILKYGDYWIEELGSYKCNRKELH